MINNIIFNGKNSYKDFELILEKKTIVTPSKKKIKVDVPFMNGSYDFSTIGSNGEIIYNQREISVSFLMKVDNVVDAHARYSFVMQWLEDIKQNRLIFSDIADYYFMAEVEEGVNFEQISNHLTRLQVKFVADPFKISVNYVGSDIWDTFNFLEDITQFTDYDVAGTKTVKIYNAGRKTSIEIVASSNFKLTYDSIIYNVVKGANNLQNLKLKNGYNDIIIEGTGNIKFNFRKETI